MSKIQPIPSSHGYGFTSLEPQSGFRFLDYKEEGRYHNYFFNRSSVYYPAIYESRPVHILLDGFSPNLNKTLHVGHLRNLMLASSLVKLTHTSLKPIAMLGVLLGENFDARDHLSDWMETAQYSPMVVTDEELVAISQTYSERNLIELHDGVGDKEGTKVFHGPHGPVVAIKSNGMATYAYHDLLLAAIHGPTHYLTGMEQKQHFADLGLGDKHLPMGLVVDEGGVKLKSRTGDAMSALEVVSAIQDRIGGDWKLAWNIAAWNFLSIKRQQNAKFLPEAWTHPDKGGLYVSYTYARANSALQKANVVEDHAPLRDLWDEEDIPLLGTAAYFDYYLAVARERLDPAPLANFALDLSRKIGSEYAKHRVMGGRKSFQQALLLATTTLGKTMEHLTMNKLVHI